MPQMAPMFWTLLTVMFMTILLTFTVKLYFYLSDTPPRLSGRISTNLKPCWAW
uniref:ATP synthase 8 n=1 Tax=Proasellus margalefi TaxID=1281998 RepID=A0A485M9I8_9CRUS|nr:ATP synthase 8 [Proasellus margalefi]